MICSRCQKRLDPSPDRPFGHGWYLFNQKIYCTDCWLSTGAAQKAAGDAR